MSTDHLRYRERAAGAQAEAAEATLQNVKDRCLRAEAAWTAMAERQERLARARTKREAEAA